jgi:transcriptional regulator with XRE-family HTH domain
MGSSGLHRLPYRRFCRLLREWREAAGLTQRAMAARLRRPASYVHKSEVGERRIDPLEFIEWCRACGVDPGEAIRKIG